MRTTSLSLIALCLVGASCASPDAAPLAEPPLASPAMEVSAALAPPSVRSGAGSLNLGAVVDRMRRRYQVDGAGFVGGDSSYRARVADGRLLFSPVTDNAPSDAALGLETRSVERGGRSLLDPVRSSIDPDGSLRVARGEVVERLLNRAEGVEQTWTFGSPPSGEGDLRVRVTAEGMTLIATTSRGLHFASGEHGVRYGHGTWVDADGARSAVPARWVDGAIELRIPAALLERSVYPAVLDPVVGPEIAVDTPVPGLAPAGFEPAMASDGMGVTLVVWPSSGIVGTRVDAMGTVLDPDGLIIAEGAEGQQDPDVIFDGTQFVVVWEDGRPGGSTDIYGARVARDGTVMDPLGFAICTAAGSQTQPAVAFDGMGYMVAFEDDRGPGTGRDIYVARFDAANTALDPNGVQVHLDGDRPRIAFGGTRFLVAFEDGSDIAAARIDTDARVVDTTALSIAATSNFEEQADVAFDGTHWMVVWREGTHVRGTEVDSDGRRLAAFDLNGSDFRRDPAVAFGGGEYLVTWRDSTRVSAARVSASAVPVAGVRPVSIGARGLAGTDVAHDGTQWLVIWRDGGMRGARVASDGTLLDNPNLDISIGGHHQRYVDVSFGGTQWLAVWLTRANHRAPYRVVATRVALDGTILDPAGIELANNARLGGVAASYAAGEWLVAWTSGGQDLHGARVDASGAIVGSRIVLNDASGIQRDPSIAYGGRDWLVVFEDTRSGVLFDTDVWGTRVATDGTVLDPAGILIESTDDSDSGPQVASNGTHWLVAWDHWVPPGPFHSVWVRRVDAAGAFPDVAVRVDSGRDPAVASDGTEWLLAFSQRTANQLDVRATRVRPPIVLVDSPLIDVSVGPNDEASPAVTYEGSTWLAAWTDERGFPAAADLYGAQINTAGALLDPSGFPVSEARGVERLPALASDGAGQALVGYTRSEGTAHRAYLRLLGRCDPTGSDETACDGVDDDCDGAADEDFAAAATTCGLGVCAASGASTCADGMLGDSCVPGTPGASDDALCDGDDTDCDGAFDEDYVPVMTTCAGGGEAMSRCVAGMVDDGCSGPADGGLTDRDAASGADAGPDAGGGGGTDEGCGCRAAGTPGRAPFGLFAVGLALLALRRRR